MPHKIEYLIRNFLFGLAFFAVLYFGLYPILAKNSHSNGANNFLILIIVNAFCYPFAKAVYDTVIGYLMGDRVYITGIFITIFIRFWVFWFSFFLAPFYVLFFIPKGFKLIKNKGAE